MKEIKISGDELRRLFEAIGKKEGLGRILDRFYEKMSQDPLVGFFFDGKDVKQIASRQEAFIMRAWGASPSYHGKSPADAHAQLPPILEGHFNRRLVLLAETLRDFGLNEAKISVWLGFEETFRQAVEGGGSRP